MFRVDTTGIDEQIAELTDLEREQLPFAAALALTRTAQDVEQALVSEMQNVFDRPTRWTLNGLRVFPATKQKLVARVWMKNESDKAAPATTWLTPEVYGGPRRDKRTESMLKAKGILPADRYVAPGDGAELDQFGNMKRGQLTRMLSGVRGFTETGYSANATGSVRSRRKGNAKSFFVMRKGKDPIGIAQRVGRKRDDVKMIVAFVRKPNYTKRYRFFEVADQVAEQRLPERFKEAMAQAMRTRRPR
ncbi:hypothetical protein [Pseudomonas sp. Marseille-QA0892]